MLQRRAARRRAATSRRWPVVDRLAVEIRRALARHRWLRTTVIVTIAVAAAASTLQRIERIDAARAAWGDTRPVLVATRAAEPGDPLVAEVRDLPAAMVPDRALPGALGDDELVARQHLAPGEVVTDADVRPAGPLALVPAGWVAVAVVESPASGASPGERVQVASDGVLVADEALVVGHTADATLVAVPSGVGPLVPLAATDGRLALLRVP